MGTPELICGIDEAGRGPLAGPVCAAAVVLKDGSAIRGLNDSKLLTEKRRDAMAIEIRQQALAFGIGWASVEEIDSLNVRQANFLAMRRAFEALGVQPGLALVDGNDPPPLGCRVRAIVGGDRLEPAISAASILAKTARDAVMVQLCARYPGYGFAKHKGYGSAMHLEALRTLGPCPIHRRSFSPVREALAKTGARRVA